MSVLVDTLWVEIIPAAVFLILIGSILFFNLSLVFLVTKKIIREHLAFVAIDA